MYYKTYLILAVIATAIAACQPSTEKKETAAPAAMTHEDMVARGKYLVSILDCNVCHTPKIMTPTGPTLDTTRILSGHPADFPEAPYDAKTLQGWTITNAYFTNWIGAFGKTYAANLTPDSTGLGTWKEENFINAMRKGKHMGMDQQRPIMPPMPWEAFGHMPDEDLKALWAYLQSIPPVKNAVPVYMPPMPGNM